MAAPEPADGERLALSLAQELRAGLREFDVIGRTAPDTFLILIPEPEGDVTALLGPLARRAREAIRREPSPTLSESLRLEFGYATFPADGQTSRALLEAARRDAHHRLGRAPQGATASGAPRASATPFCVTCPR